MKALLNVTDKLRIFEIWKLVDLVKPRTSLYREPKDNINTTFEVACGEEASKTKSLFLFSRKKRLTDRLAILSSITLLHFLKGEGVKQAPV